MSILPQRRVGIAEQAAIKAARAAQATRAKDSEFKLSEIRFENRQSSAIVRSHRTKCSAVMFGMLLRSVLVMFVGMQAVTMRDL